MATEIAPWVAWDEETERQAVAFAPAGDRVRAMASHPDLAALICRAYLFDRISQWSGYIPPREWAEKRNDSPLRRAVVEACAEAWRRENQTARNSNEREAQ